MDPKAVFQSLKTEPDAEAMALEQRELLDSSEQSDSDALAAIVAKLEKKDKGAKTPKEEDDDEDEAEDAGISPSEVTPPSTQTTPKKIHAPKTAAPEPSAVGDEGGEEVTQAPSKIDCSQALPGLAWLSDDGQTFFYNKNLPTEIQNNGKALSPVEPLLVSTLQGEAAEEAWIKDNGYDLNAWNAWCENAMSMVGQDSAVAMDEAPAPPVFDQG